MKRILLLLVSLLVISNIAMADHIGIFTDATGVNCNLGPAGVFNPNAVIIHKFSLGTTGSRFKATFPAGTTIFAFTTPWGGIPAADVSADIAIAYGQCLTGSFVVGTLIAMYGAGQAAIRPADGFNYIIVTDCSFTEMPATGGPAYIGTTGPCEFVAVEPSTWGNVKALYR